MVYIVPVNYEDLKKAMPKKEKQMNILRQAAKLRKSMPKSSDSIKLIQEMRMHGK
jgi:hypothetical protein